MADYLVGLDNGGTKTKCAVFDLEGNEIGTGSGELPLETPREGWTERDAEAVWRVNVQAVREALERAGIDPGAVIGVGLTGYGNGACFTDGRGEAVYPCIVSTDSRASGYLEQWEKDGTMQAVYERTWQKIWDAQPAALIPWFRDHNPEVLEKASYVLDIKDYIRCRLTGSICGEITAASSGCLMNIRTLQYDREIFRLLGIEKYYGINPPCVGSTDISGYITKEAAELTGLPEGIPVSGGYFDIDAGALASGVTDEETLCLIAGTWSINEYITKDLESGYGKFSNTAGYLPGWYVVEDSSPTSAGNLEWFLQSFLKNEKKQYGDRLYEICNGKVESVAPEDSDLIFVPYVYASATNPRAKGMFLGMSAYHGTEHLLRAVYEGVAFSTAFHVERLIRGRGVNYRTARFSGGASRSSAWTQMVCDILQIPVEVPKASELSAMGAAMSAGIACGAFRDPQEAVSKMVRIDRRYEPCREKAEIYRRKLENYKRAVGLLDRYYAT